MKFCFVCIECRVQYFRISYTKLNLKWTTREIVPDGINYKLFNFLGQSEKFFIFLI